MTRAQILRQIAEARRSMKALANLYPGAFDKNGRPLVAVAAFPRLPKDCGQCLYVRRFYNDPTTAAVLALLNDCDMLAAIAACAVKGAR